MYHPHRAYGGGALSYETKMAFLICRMAFFSSRETCACDMPTIEATSICVFAVVKAQREDALFPPGQTSHGVIERHALDPALVRVARVAHLIHDRETLAAVGKHRVGETHGVADRVERESDLLPGNAESGGDLLLGRLAAGLGGELFARLQNFVRGIAHAARHAQGAVVAQIPADLPGDHRHAVGGKAHVVRLGVKVVDGLDEPDAPDLKEIVDILPREEKRWMTDSTSRRLPAISSSRADLSPCRTRSSRRRVVALSSTASFEVLTPQISTFPCIYSKTSSGKR